MSDPRPSPAVPAPRDLRESTAAERDELARVLYEVLGPRVLALGYRYFGGDRHRAEDLVSETFARILVGLPHFRGQSAYGTWILRIAMNVAIDWTTRGRARRERPLEEGASEPAEREALGGPARAEAGERDELVRRAVSALGPEHRMLLSLVALEGVSQAAAAELLGIPEGTVWSRYARARLALASEFARLGLAEGSTPARPRDYSPSSSPP